MASPPMAKPGDSDLWRAALRDVKPLRRRKPAAAPQRPPPIAPPAPAAVPAPAPAARAVPAALPPITGPRAPGLDKASAERLKRGRDPLEARIDLHGMTQDDAHRTLGEFLARSARDELRCVLVITGKGLRPAADGSGRADAIGILRNAVPRWLNEAPNRARILAFGVAQPRDGGGGALYILLRRSRSRQGVG